MKFGTLEVYPRQGLLQEHGLDLPSAIVGRGEGAAIVIDDFSISRRHARLTIDSGRLLIEDLGSFGGTFVDGERIEPGVRHLVEDGSDLRFGEIGARYLPAANESPATAPPVAATGEVAQAAAGGLVLALASPGVPVEPGKRVTATVSVTNAGRVIDTVRIEVPDLPDGWYTVETPAVAILPGGRAEVAISIHPPRRHDAVSGEYTFTVVARSREYDEHPEAVGRLQVLPFEAVSLSLEAVRSKKHFRLLAENHGNDVVLYQLAGRDDEQAFAYWFETPAVELQPGQKRIVSMTVKRPRQLFGHAVALPFEVVGTASHGAEITARGQLAVNPPLQKFRMPATFALLAMVLAATALAVLVLTDGDGAKTASAEDKFAGVHLCEDKEAVEKQAEKNEKASTGGQRANATVVGPYGGGRPLFGEVDSNGAPFFAQSDPRWGGDEYARSMELPAGKDWCGTTIEQCGCAMTSVSVMLALYDLLQMPDGSALSPKTLNDWFNGNARKTDRGWVSRGYIYGDVIWSAANELSGEIAKVKPGATTVRFVRTGSGSEDEIRADLQAGRPVIVEVPGHWIAAVGLDGDQILINDPFYRDRKTLDAYKGKVRSSVHYEPSTDLSAVVITAPADVKFKVTDRQGRVVATGDGTVEQPAHLVNQIPGASIAAKQAWRDPTCIESAPPPGAGTNQIVLPGARDDYVIEIVGTGSEPASVAVHTYGKDGASSIATIEGEAGTQAELGYDPNQARPTISITNNGTPAATTTPQPAGGAGGGDEETPSPGATLPATPTPTPFVEQRTAMTLPGEPGQTRVEVATNSGFELGDPIRFAPGQPNEEDNIIVGFGSFLLATPLKFAHSPGEVIARLPRPAGQGPGLPPGVTPPPNVGPLVPPDSVALACSTLYQANPKQATYVCDATVAGAFTNTRWSLNGIVVPDFTGATSFIYAFGGDQPAAIAVTVCNQTLCRSATRTDQIAFPKPDSGGSGSQGAARGIVTPTATPPPAGQVAVVCGTEFPITPDGQVAQFNCTANFSGTFTSVSWSAPGGSPANKSGVEKTFTTTLRNVPGMPVSLKVTATVCNFGNCRSSQATEVGIGRTVTLIDSSPVDTVNQGHKLTLMARVQGIGKVVPQGGTVQFYADGFEIGPSATLFTVGAVAVAQVAVETTGLTTSTDGSGTPLPHSFKAAYSGGVNAFGSESDPPRIINVLPPIPDGCDSVNNDEDPNNDGVPDDNVTDGTCRFTTPKDLGAGTTVNSIELSGAGVVQDGAANAVIVGPGTPITVTGSAGRTTYCPGCIRQVYLGIGGNETTGTPPLGPACVVSGVLPEAPSGSHFVYNLTAPSVPGVYYLRATTTLDYFCVGPAVGPPETSVARVIVRQQVSSNIELWNDGPIWPQCKQGNPASCDTPAEYGDPLTFAGRNTVNGIQEGERVVLRAVVPQGATGRIEFQTNPPNILRLNGGVPAAEICPASGEIDRPVGTPDIVCTPWEARVLTDAVPEVNQPVTVTATYVDPDPLVTIDPADPTPPFDAKTYDIRFPATPSSNTLNLKVLVPATVEVTGPLAPVEIGTDFTLTAEVTSTNGALGLNGFGGQVQFKAGPNAIGQPVPVQADGTASITWRAGINPGSCSATPCGGFPFDTKDTADRSEYNNVYAEYITGGASLLQNACTDATGWQEPNCLEANIDIDPAGSTVTINSVEPNSAGGSCAAATFGPGSVVAGQCIRVTATVTGVPDFPPTGGNVVINATGGALTSDNGVVGNASVAEVSPGVFQAVVTFVTGSASAVMDTPGNYTLTAVFDGTSALDTSTSADFNLSIGKEPATVSLSLTGVANCPPPETTQFCASAGTAGLAHAVVAAPDTGFVDNNGATLRLLNGGAAVGADYNLTNSDAGAHDFALRALSPGTYTLTVEYSGNDYFSGPVSSDPVVLVISKSTAALSLTGLTRTTDMAPAGSNSVGDVFRVTANVNPGGSPSAAGGTITLTATIGGVPTTLGTHTLTGSDDGSHNFTLDTSSGVLATTSAISLSFSYDGNDDLTAETLATPVALGPLAKAQPTVTTTTTSSVDIGGAITVTYSITAPAGLTVDCPTASPCVELRAGSSTGTPIASISIGSSFNALSTGGSSGTCLDSVGSCAIWVTYTGNDLLASALDSDSTTISKVTPTVQIVANDVTINGSSSVTISVSDTGGNSADCSDCMSVRAGSTTVLSNLDWPADGSLTVPTGSGATGAFAGTCLANAGTCTLTVQYSGNARLNGASDSDTFTISKIATSTAVSLSPGSTVTIGATVTVTATVTQAGGGSVPNCTNCVRFRLASDTGSVIGSAQDISGGTASITITTGTTGGFTSPGSPVIFAVYDGTGTFASSSASSSLTINAAPTTLTATAAQTGGTGSPTRLTAAITSLFGTQNDIDPGTVQFTIDGVDEGSPVNVNNGAATLDVTLAPGTYQVTATYSGGGDYAGSSDTTDFQIVVT